MELKGFDRMEFKYRTYIEDRYSEVFEYIKTERKGASKEKYRYYVTVRCRECGIEKTATMEAYKYGIKCKCNDSYKYEASARTYARELFVSME